MIWEWDCFDIRSEQSTSSANSSSGDENLVEIIRQLDIDEEQEEEEEDFVLHTLPFKVMGVAYKTERMANNFIQSAVDIACAYSVCGCGRGRILCQQLARWAHIFFQNKNGGSNHSNPKAFGWLL